MFSPQQSCPRYSLLLQVPLLHECVHYELFICLGRLGDMGASDRLDGTPCYQPPPGLRRPGGHMAEGRRLTCMMDETSSEALPGCGY